jgi:glycosyltransferase involved in cell wall biosynthesis
MSLHENTRIYSITVVICTRNRSSVLETLQSVLANDHPDFEVVVVDQSTHTGTEDICSPYFSNSNVTYIRSYLTGAGNARNAGLSAAHSPIIAFIDDDCTVGKDWIAQIGAFFEMHPDIAVLFTNVNPVPHDSRYGFIPNQQYKKRRVIKTVPMYFAGLGMGAGMSIRKETAVTLCGFDPCLGPGSIFPSAEDLDFALRALLNNYTVIENPDIHITHHGFRTYQEFRSLTQRDWFGIGGALVKHLRCRHWNVLFPIAYNISVRGFLKPLSNILNLETPRGFRRLTSFFSGFIYGLTHPLDRQTILYRPIPSRGRKVRTIKKAEELSRI